MSMYEELTLAHRADLAFEEQLGRDPADRAYLELRHRVTRQRERAMFAAHDSCLHCGCEDDPCFSRVEPMGYYCPECGEEQG